MPSPFFTGLSGLRAHSRAVEVVANNLANLNTIGFKGSRSDFRDLFYQQVGQSRSGVASQVGIGAAPVTISRRFEQGTVQNTGGLLDAAIQGEGLFIVEDGELTLYTRAGNFQLNQDQEIVTINGELVQGWVRDRTTNTVNTNLPRGPITLQGNDRIPPTATSIISVNANLQTGSTQPFSRPIEIFDSLGAPHILTMTFTPTTPTGANSAAFTVTATLPANETVDLSTNLQPLNDPNVVVGNVVIEFDQNGALDPASATSATLDMTATTPTYSYVNGAGPLNITWNFLDDVGQPRITAVAAASAVTDLSQNGSASAELVSLSVADGGVINGLYSDGRTQQLAQLALARFTNLQALQAVGNNNYVRTAAAGEPLEGTANTGGLGSIVGLSLETSNVDIAKEFTDLLTFQRGYQANSRVITTADELNQEALNLKR